MLMMGAMKLTKKSCHCCQGSGTEFDNVSVGAKLRAAREKKGISQDFVATAMGFSKPYICDLEKGRRNWCEDKIKRYQQAIA